MEKHQKHERLEEPRHFPKVKSQQLQKFPKENTPPRRYRDRRLPPPHRLRTCAARPPKPQSLHHFHRQGLRSDVEREALAIGANHLVPTELPGAAKRFFVLKQKTLICFIAQLLTIQLRSNSPIQYVFLQDYSKLLIALCCEVNHVQPKSCRTLNHPPSELC